MPRFERLKLSCTKRHVRQALAKVRSDHASRKNPRASPNTCGSMMTTSGMSVAMTFMASRSGSRLLENLLQIQAIGVLAQGFGKLVKFAGTDPAVAECDLLR